jgi:hypothetical protein
VSNYFVLSYLRNCRHFTGRNKILEIVNPCLNVHACLVHVPATDIAVYTRMAPLWEPRFPQTEILWCSCLGAVYIFLSSAGRIHCIIRSIGRHQAVHGCCITLHPTWGHCGPWILCDLLPVTWRVRAQLKCDGTRWRTGGEVKGKLANGVGSQYSSHYLGTWCIQHYYRWCPQLGWQQSTELTPPADLNGLVRLAERRNLVSAYVPSDLKRSLRDGLTWRPRENACRRTREINTESNWLQKCLHLHAWIM